MSNMRQKFRVAWNDGDDVVVTTSARDFAAAQDYSEDPTMGTFALIHSALNREGYDVGKLDEWVDLLDNMEQVSGNGEVDSTPTQPGALPNAQ